MNCKNCQHPLEGNYCSNCGQSAATSRIDAHYVGREFGKTFIKLERGILYSTKELLTRPGHSIREFIEGKRMNHYPALPLVLIMAAFYQVITINLEINTAAIDVSSASHPSEIQNWITNHFAWMVLASIPIYNLGTMICFRSQGYNIYELLVLNTFKASQRLISHILLTPLYFVYKSTPTMIYMVGFSYLLDLILGFWTNVQFFNKLSPWKTILLSILSHIIFLFCVFIALVFFGIIYGLLYYTNP